MTLELGSVVNGKRNPEFCFCLFASPATLEFLASFSYQSLLGA